MSGGTPTCGARSQRACDPRPATSTSTFFELRRYLHLAAGGNPSILLLLYVPAPKLVSSTKHGRELQELAPEIVSLRAVARYRGYMRAQALRLLGLRGSGRGARTGARPELVEAYGYDTKFAMHMVRLGFQGLELCETGRLALPMSGEPLGRCREVREGRVTAEEALDLAIDLDGRLEAYGSGHSTSALRGEPNAEAINDWLHRTYLDVWESGTASRRPE